MFEALEGGEWIEAIHEAVMETTDLDDFYWLQQWWLETIEGVWKDYIAAERAKL